MSDFVMTVQLLSAGVIDEDEAKSRIPFADLSKVELLQAYQAKLVTRGYVRQRFGFDA